MGKRRDPTSGALVQRQGAKVATLWDVVNLAVRTARIHVLEPVEYWGGAIAVPAAELAGKLEAPPEFDRGPTARTVVKRPEV